MVGFRNDVLNTQTAILSVICDQMVVICRRIVDFAAGYSPPSSVLGGVSVERLGSQMVKVLLPVREPWAPGNYRYYYCYYYYFILFNCKCVFTPSGSGTTIRHKQTPWSESASELYRPSDRRLSAK
jgi:hypothetical protein